MAVVMIMVTLLLTMALVNFRMKSTNLGSQKNFYTAEMALEEIRLGLADDLGEAMSVAYIDTVQKYNELDAQEREANFRAILLQQLKTAIGYQEDGSYSLEHLSSFLKTTEYNEETGVGAQLDSEGNHVNITEEGVTLKNIALSFWGEKGYVTEIKTDMKLEYPAINFAQSSQMPDLTQYALVASNHLEVADGISLQIQGNAYLGANATDISQAFVTVLPNANSNERGLLISGDRIKVEAASNLKISDMELWANRLVVDSSSLKAQNVAVYLKDDFVLSNSLLSSTKAVVDGEFYGYGSIETAALADAVATDEEQREEIQKNPANYSSSIIINGIRSSLDLSGLDVMKISGNSYINGTEYQETYQNYGMNEQDVMMGESLSIRSDQLAYLVPAECIAPDAENGGTNPMPITQYSALQTELMKTYGEGGADYLVDLDCQTKKYGTSLKNAGVDGWQIEAQQVSGIGSLVYVFLKFDSISHANAFFRNYYDQSEQAKLGQILNLYDGEGIRLPQEVLNETANSNFYFNGNVLASDTASLYVPDTLRNTTAEQLDSLRAEEIEEQDIYAALNIKLRKEYEDLTETEKGNTVYENLVKSLVSAENADYTIGVGSVRSFTKDTGETAIVANGDFVLNTQNTATIVNKPNATISVVIASGDITVEQDFTGMLIAGGTIYVKNSAKISADAQSAKLALTAKDSNGIYASDYLVNGECYRLGKDVSESEVNATDTGIVSTADYVTYENWSRQ